MLVGSLCFISYPDEKCQVFTLWHNKRLRAYIPTYMANLTYIDISITVGTAAEFIFLPSTFGECVTLVPPSRWLDI